MTAHSASHPADAAGDEKLDFKKIMPVFVVVLIDLLGLTIIIPLMPLYAASFGASAAVIGLLGATYPLMQFIGAPILGRLSDRYGRKPVLLASQIGTLIGFLVLGFANSLPLLFLSRIIDGLSGANISTAQAIIADSTSEKTRTQGLGLLGAAFGLGFVVGPLIAFLALALSGNNYSAPAFVAAAFSLGAVLLTAFVLKETHDPAKASAKGDKAALSAGTLFRALAYPGVGILIVLMFAQQIAFGGFEQIISLFTLTRLGMDASGNAVVFVFVGVIVVMVQGYYIGKWSRRFGDRRLVLAGLALLTAGLALMAFTPPQPVPWYSRNALEQELNARTETGQTMRAGETPPTTQLVNSDSVAAQLPAEEGKGALGLAWLLVAMIPTSIGGGILQPSINSMITKRVSADERGGILGVSASSLSAANALAPVLGGFLFGVLGASAPFLAWAAIMAVLFIIAWNTLRAGREGNEPTGAPAAA
ncbi:MAG: MFS transporter [Anaerolineae bacterium]|nr:MFS transporter [Anaerolineae bacterium]